MKPNMNPPGTFFNFDAIPMWLYPDVWDETKRIRLRGLWFLLLYTLSFLVFGAIFLFLGAIIFTKPLITTMWVWIFLCVPSGIALGIMAWWDFTRRHKKLLLENAQKRSEAQIQE